MGNKKVMKENGEIFYPITSEQCVLDENGNPINTKYATKEELSSIGGGSVTSEPFLDETLPPIEENILDNYQLKTDETLPTTDKTIVGSINELFQNVSNGKTLIASAITDKGVATSENDTFAQMSTNIRNISSGGSGEIDPNAPNIIGYSKGSGYYGVEVAEVARSYHLARMNGDASFQYSQTINYFSGRITNEVGDCCLDCSSFMGLVLRGIDYCNSPYYNATGELNKTFDVTQIPILTRNSKYQWADIYLDRQTDISFNDIGIQGYRSIRNSSQIAEYFYYDNKGYVLHEYETSPIEMPLDLLPGDLIFWSKSNASDEVKARFKSISHVAVVGTDTTRYFQATGDESTKGDTIFYTTLSDHLEEISLIIRPNYSPIIKPTPSGVNLLTDYLFDSCNIDSSIVKNGVTFTPKTNGGMDIQGVATSSVTFYIRDKTNPILLEKGKYRLMGVPIHSQVNANGGATTWGISIKEAITENTFNDINGKRVWDRGIGSTFELTKDTEVYIYLYISTSLTDEALYSFNPSLVRLDEGVTKEEMKYIDYLRNKTDWSYTFYKQTDLTTIPLLDTSNATNMDSMFYGCENLTTIPQLDTSKVAKLSYMFYGCENLTTIPQLDTSSATDMANMFYNCRNLTTIRFNSNATNIADFSISYCTLMTREDLVGMFESLPTITSTVTITLGTTLLDKLSETDKAIAINKGYTLV